MELKKSRVLLAKPEDHLPLSLSVSKYKTFKDCKAKYRFCYVEKLPRKEWDFHIFGKFLHEILEIFYRKILEGNKDAPNVVLTSSWKEAFVNWKSKLNDGQISEAKEICSLFLKKLSEDTQAPTVLGVEKDFYIDIDGKVLLNGFIDRVQLDTDGVLHVSDYKTTKNKKYLKNDYFQLLTYAFVMCLEDESIQKVRTSYILLRHGFESFVKEFTREEVMSIEETFLEAADKIHGEKLFRPSPSNLCKYCDYLDHCDAGQRAIGHVTNKYGEDSW